MATIKCKSCGSNVLRFGDECFGTCELCLRNQTIPKTSNYDQILIYNEAFDYLKNKNFEKAFELFKKILSSLPDESEALIGLAKCEYKISFDDNNRCFICDSPSEISFLENKNIIAAIDNAFGSVVEKYKNEFIEIEEARKKAYEKQKRNKKDNKDNNSSKLINDAFQALEDENWILANELAEDEITLNPKNPKAYLCKFLSEIKISTIDKISDADKPFDSLFSYQLAIKYCEEDTIELLKKLSEEVTYKYNCKIYDSAKRLENSTSIGAVEKAIEIYESIIDFKDSKEKIEACKKHLEILEYRYAIFDAKATIDADEGDLTDAALLYIKAEDGKMARKFLSHLPRLYAASNHTVFIQPEGKLKAIGENKYSQCEVSKWDNITAVACSYSHTLGLKKDGTVWAIGGTGSGKCDVSAWKDIKAIAAGPGHSVGLKKDGTVVAVGYRHDDRCKVSEWDDIISIKAGDTHTVGLKKDGTLVSVGTNDYGQCNVKDWENIISVSIGEFHTVGLKNDGKVVACGKNAFGECNVSEWEDIIGIAAGDDHTIGLKNDGTLVYTGSNEYGQCDVSNWGDIVYIVAGSYHTVGLHSDGTFIATGMKDDGRCDVSEIKVEIPITEETKEFIKKIDSETDIGILKEEYKKIESVSMDILERILKKDAEDEAERIKQAKKKKEAEEKRKAESAERMKQTKAALAEKKKAEKALSEERLSKGLCPYCGGEYKGIFSKKCSVCSRPKQ